MKCIVLSCINRKWSLQGVKESPSRRYFFFFFFPPAREEKIKMLLLISRNLSVCIQFACLSWGRGTRCRVGNRRDPMSYNPFHYWWFW